MELFFHCIGLGVQSFLPLADMCSTSTSLERQFSVGKASILCFAFEYVILHLGTLFDSSAHSSEAFHVRSLAESPNGGYMRPKDYFNRGSTLLEIALSKLYPSFPAVSTMPARSRLLVTKNRSVQSHYHVCHLTSGAAAAAISLLIGCTPVSTGLASKIRRHQPGGSSGR